MSQGGSSYTPGRGIIYTPKTVAIAALAAVAIGAVFLVWFYGKTNKDASYIRDETQRLGEELGSFKSDTNSKIAEFPQSQQAMQERIQELETTLTEASADLGLLRQQASDREAANAVSLADITALYHQGQEVEEAIEVLQTDLTEWTVEYTALLSKESEDGRRIAASPALLRQFMGAADQGPVSQRDIDSWRGQLEGLLTPVERAYRAKDSSVQATASLTEKFNELEAQLDETATKLRQQRAAVSAIRKQALHQAIPEGDMSLELAIAAELERRALEAVQIREEQLEKVRRELDQKILEAITEAEQRVAEAKAKSEEALGEIKARQIADATDDRLREDRERAEQRQEKLAREKLEAELQRDRDSILAHLTVFMAPGFRQPTRNGGYATSTVKGPVSLSSLNAVGALAPSIHGLAALSKAAERSDRPNGGWPRLTVSGGRLAQAGLGIYPVAPDQEFLQRAQDLLNKYGELMVEKKMLAP